MNATKTFKLVNESVREYSISAISALPLHPTYEVVVRRRKKNRSASQNALYWQWLTQIAGEMGELKEWVHEDCKRRFLVPIYERDDVGFAEMIEAVRNVARSGGKVEAEKMACQIVRLTSTTTATVEQFTEYLNDIERDANQRGIFLPHPEDIYYEAMYGKVT